MGRDGSETTETMAAQLAQALAVNASVLELELGGNQLGWRACRELLDVLMDHPTLTHLGLADNAMNPKNLAGLVQARAGGNANENPSSCSGVLDLFTG